MSKPAISRGDLVAYFSGAIAAGRLAAGERLPTIRAVAAQWGVPRAVAHAAYRDLQASGLVLATVGRGTVVAGGDTEARLDPLARAARAALRACEDATTVPGDGQPASVADFAQFLPDSAGFAVDEFGAALERVLRSRGRELLGYGNPAGDDELRRRLVDRHRGSDPHARSEDVLITSGAQQGIDLVLRTFTSPGDAVVVPVPCYHHLFGLLASHGLEVVPVPWRDDGVDLDALAHALRMPRARLLYVMPTFQNPTGRTLGAAQRAALMRVVAATQVPVLEDDCAAELRFAGQAQVSLRTLDERGLTVSVRSFSKELFPGVRIGWLVAGETVLPAMAALKRFCDLETTPLLQAALGEFIADGSLDRHLAQLRAQLRERHAQAQSALVAHMPGGAHWSQPEGGFALWLTLPASVDGESITTAAARRGVRVTPGSVFDPERRPSSSVRLSLSRVTPQQIRAGIEVLAVCAQRAPASRLPLFL